jgi:lipoate-protein ligase A
MARDLALTRSAHHEDRATLRTYDWQRPTISFGRNEAVLTSWDVDAMLAAGYDVVRRPTGGRALLHSREITWSVTLPVPDDVPWRRVYEAVNTRLVIALQSMGVPATLHTGSGKDAEALRDGSTCYAQPSAGELVLGEAKLGGSSVWRTECGYLQHGSILLENDQALLAPFARGLNRHDTDTHDASSIREALRANTHGTDGVSVAEFDATASDSRVKEALAAAFGVASTSSYRIVETPAYQLAFVSAREQIASNEWFWRR